jgi:hypothetical protein
MDNLFEEYLNRVYSTEDNAALEHWHEASRDLERARVRFGNDHPETAHCVMAFHAAEAACSRLGL